MFRVACAACIVLNKEYIAALELESEPVDDYPEVWKAHGQEHIANGDLDGIQYPTGIPEPLTPDQLSRIKILVGV